MNLPTHEECLAMKEAGEGTALSNFIYEQEPAGLEDSEQFRKGLTALIEEVKTPKPKIVSAQPDEKRRVFSIDNIIYEEPESVSLHIVADLENSEDGDEFEYTVKVTQMTQIEIDNLPEAEL